MSMQIDACLKKGAMVPFLSGWGHRKGVLGGGGQGVQPKFKTPRPLV